MRLILLIMFFYSATLMAQPKQMIEHRVWNKTPIHIVLPVGIERRIDFPVSIQLQIPETLQIMSERIQITEDGSVYWVASKSFKKMRVNAITETGYSYLLDIESKPKGHTHPISIIDYRVPVDSRTNEHQSTSGSNQDYDYVDLMRFASQSVYAPTRLIKPLTGVKRIPVESESLQLVRGGDLITEPLAQWVANTVPTLYLTAIRVTSNALKIVELDPRKLRGDFVAATSQHGYVNEAGKDGDTTTWYLISMQPFSEVAR